MIRKLVLYLPTSVVLEVRPGAGPNPEFTFQADFNDLGNAAEVPNGQPVPCSPSSPPSTTVAVPRRTDGIPVDVIDAAFAAYRNRLGVAEPEGWKLNVADATNRFGFAVLGEPTFPSFNRLPEANEIITIANNARRLYFGGNDDGDDADETLSPMTADEAAAALGIVSAWFSF